EMYQVLDGPRVLASALILRSQTTAYYHSAGSSAEGMSIGAAKFLIFRACAELRKEGVSELNLGGARSQEHGMRAFKENFGARRTNLSEASLGDASLRRSVCRRRLHVDAGCSPRAGNGGKLTDDEWVDASPAKFRKRLARGDLPLTLARE